MQRTASWREMYFPYPWGCLLYTSDIASTRIILRLSLAWGGGAIRDYSITRSTIIELFFLRHGIAEDQPSKGNRDADRALTKEGIVSMQLSARGMVRIGLQLDHLVSSPLTRAIQTAEIVGKALVLRPRVEAALAPGFDIAQLRRLLSCLLYTSRCV